MKFSIGDKVVVVSVDRYSAPYHKVGDVLTVNDIMVGKENFICFFVEKPNNGLYESELRLASESALGVKFEFGMIVEERSGELLMVVKEHSSDCLFVVNENGNWAYVTDYDTRTLKHKSQSQRDIVAVYGLSAYVHRALEFNVSTRNLLWKEDGAPDLERPTDTQELTVAEVSRRLGYDVKIVK